MKRLTTGIMAHVDAGKTTLTEAMLYLTGNIRRLGRVDHGDAFLDTQELERERGITIYAKQAILRRGDLELTLVDTPGHVDFSAETERALRHPGGQCRRRGPGPHRNPVAAAGGGGGARLSLCQQDGPAQ